MLLSESATSSKPPDSAFPVARGVETGKRLWLVLFILLSLEIGAFLVVAPWSSAWDRNLVVGYLSWLRPLLLSPYVRGAVSGLGVINLWVGISQARDFRRRKAPPS